MGALVIKLNKVPLFARKRTNINVSMSAAPKVGLVPAIRYNCFAAIVVIRKSLWQGLLELNQGLLFAKNGQISMFRGLLHRN